MTGWSFLFEISPTSSSYLAALCTLMMVSALRIISFTNPVFCAMSISVKNDARTDKTGPDKTGPNKRVRKPLRFMYDIFLFLNRDNVCGNMFSSYSQI